MKLTLHQIEQCDEIAKNIPALAAEAEKYIRVADGKIHDAARDFSGREDLKEYRLRDGEVGQKMKPLGESAAHCLAEATRCVKTARGLFVLAARTLHEESSAMAVGESSADRQILLGYLVDSAVGQLRAAEEKFAEAKAQLDLASKLYV